MKAYWTIIKDAFLAAVVSKILYVMLAIIGLVLLALAPLGYKELMDYAVAPRQVRDPERIASRLIEASKSEEPSQLKLVWEKLPANTQKRIVDLIEQLEKADGDNPLARAQQADFLRIAIGEAFRSMVKEDGWFDPQFLDKEEASEELVKLSEASTLADEKLWRRNRLALDNLFPLELAPSGGTVMQFGWLGMYPFENIALTRSEFQLFATLTIPYILDKLVLSIGVLVAILFTASMIPELLEPGSLNLLLSKPMSRTGLFLSKFIGACSFALLNALILFSGLWLILGVRLDMWNVAFLASIPIYVFVFAIYYSVSAFVGMLTRSTILSIVAAILFWIFCFSIGFTHDLVNGFMVAAEPRGLVVQGDQSLMLNIQRQASTVNNSGEWVNAFESAEAQAMPAFMRSLIGTTVTAGPVYDSSRDRFIIVSAGIGDGPRRPMAEMNLMSAGPDTDWKSEVHQTAPPYTMTLQKLDEESCVLVTLFGEFYQLKFADLNEGSTLNSDSDETVAVEVGFSSEDGTEISSTDIEETINAAVEASGDPSQAGAVDAFVNVSPLEALPTGATRMLAYDPALKAFALWHEGVLFVVRWNGTRFELAADEQFELGEDQDVDSMAMGGGQVYLRGNKEIVIVDVANRQVRRQVWNGMPVTAMVAEPSGVGALAMDSDGYLWLVRADGEIARVNGSADGRFRGITVDDAGACWAIERYYGLEKIDLQQAKTVDYRSQPTNMTVGLYRYGISPIYELSPKPGEFYKMVRALVIVMNRDENKSEASQAEGDEPVEVDNDEVGELDSLVNSDAWKPAINGLVFIGLMLLVSAFIFNRLDL